MREIISCNTVSRTFMLQNMQYICCREEFVDLNRPINVSALCFWAMFLQHVLHYAQLALVILTHGACWKHEGTQIMRPE